MGTRAAPESLEMQRIPCISMVWAVVWGVRAAPESLEMHRIPYVPIVILVWVVL